MRKERDRGKEENKGTALSQISGFALG